MKDQLATPDALVQLRFGCQQPSPFFPLSDPDAAVQMETTLSEWHVQASKDCSEATSFDELPAPILKNLVGFASPILLHWLLQLRNGHSTFFLQAAIHLCLKKKVPH